MEKYKNYIIIITEKDSLKNRKKYVGYLENKYDYSIKTSIYDAIVYNKNTFIYINGADFFSPNRPPIFQYRIIKENLEKWIEKSRKSESEYKIVSTNEFFKEILRKEKLENL